MLISPLAADDAVLDALGGDPATVALVMALLMWRRDIDAVPVPNFAERLTAGDSDG